MNRFLRARVFWALFSLLLIATVSLWGQETVAELSGVVKDAAGDVFPGVSITITNKTTRRVVTTQTGNDGAYGISNLEPGRYAVRFEVAGFASQEVADILLLVGQRLRVDAYLEVSPVEQTITVIERSPLLDLTSATLGHNATAEEFRSLPKARSFQSLLLTSPFVTSGTDQFGNIVGVEGGWQVNGASSAENLFTIDGVPTTSLINGRSRQNALLEFLEEVQVKTAGIEAEYGGATGGVLSAVTQSGGNAFHGSLHYYLSGSLLSAGPIPRLLLDPVTERAARFVLDEKQPDTR